MWVWRAVKIAGRGVMVVHVLDIIAFTLLMYFTEGVASPFFVYFMFAVIAGALRWLWRGALWTGLAVLVAFLTMGFYHHYGLPDAEIDEHYLVVRAVSLGVVAILLAYMTAYEQRLREELASLAAREAVDFQASLLDAVEQAVLATDGEGHILYWNRFAEDLYGWKASEATGRSLADLITFIQGDGQHLEMLGRCLKGVSWTGEAEAVRRDGSRFPAYLVCSRLKGDAPGYVSLSMDISASKRAQQALRDSEEKYSTLVESSPIGVFIFQDGMFVFVNPGFAELLEYSREALLQLEPWLVLHPDDRDRVREIARKRLEGERVPGEYECRLVTSTGQVRWVAMHNTLIRHRGALATLGNVQDLTEHKRMETELRQLSARLLGVQEEERRRVARDLHDSLGQTLTGIKFAVEAALGELWPQERRAGIERLRSLVPTIQEAVEEVRRISTELRPSTLDDLGLLATIAWYLREFEKTYPHLAVERHVNATESDVRRDLRTPIFRILQEATNNAAKHSGASRLEVVLETSDGSLRLRVRDDGVGFDPRVPRAEPGKGGSGLGSMRERTELSGGFFTVSSAPGVGTTVQAEWRLDSSVSV
jgi:PAS domain S-box-containing protein